MIRTPADILRQTFGYESFRPHQQGIVEAALAGKDVLAVMPTSAGKSICYQVPAIALAERTGGLTVVVSPLISLMADQVGALRQYGVAASCLNSTLTGAEQADVLHGIAAGALTLVYVAPERLDDPALLTVAAERGVALLAVDEAHCISQWGNDFRPSYQRIIEFIDALPARPPVMALTATATKAVRDDIARSLGLRDPHSVLASFDRPNLKFLVERPATRKAKDARVASFILEREEQSGIVYCSSRRAVEELCDLLRRRGIPATRYHAGLSAAEREQNQADFLYDRARVMVATNAFGMGIDKPDVRLVLHADCPNSLEAYFQEAGRAGRDGKKAYAVLLYNGHDERKMDKRIVEEFPDKQFIRDVYEHLAYFYQIALGDGRGHTFLFDITKFCQTFHHFSIQTNSALKILQRAGYIYYDMEPDAMARVRFLLDRDDLYRLDNSSADEDAVVLALLRHYSGLFTDYSYIDENAVAYHSGLTRQQVYLILKSLSQRHIIHYIPQRKLPTITYTRDREAADRLVLSPEVYDQRREQFVHRIKVILAYATNDDVCRSRQLLRYFGETRSTDCGICDVCLGHASSDSVSDDASAAVCERILRLLSDGKRHAVSEFASSHGPHANVAFEAVAYLIGEEKICCEDGEVWIEKKK